MLSNNIENLFAIRSTDLNIKNVKICATLGILVQCFLLGRNIYFYGISFHYYVQLYLAMLIASLLIFLAIHQIEKIGDVDRRTLLAKRAILLYYLFTLLWGVFVTILDQSSSGQVTALLINVLIASSLLVSNFKTFLSLHTIPVITLLVGFSFIEINPKLLSANLINIGVFYIFAAISSRSIYKYIAKSFEQELSLNEQNQLLEQLNDELLQLANKDALTNLANRHYLQRFLKEKLQTPQHVTIFMLDIDSFKLYNDYYGHLQGDEVLVRVASILQQVALEHHLIAVRLGGEEFALFGFDLSNDAAAHIAEIICTQVEAAEIPHEKSAASSFVTVSLGYVQLEQMTFVNFTNVLEMADQALYAAKNNGRNQFQQYRPELSAHV